MILLKAKYLVCLKLIWVLILLMPNQLHAQTISGQVFGEDDREPLAFVTVALGGSSSGVISDVDGRYSLSIPTGFTGQVIFQHVGYVRRAVLWDDLLLNPDIFLEKEVTELNEVVFEAGENPAVTLLKKVIKDRKKNNPLKYDQYSYTAYSKDVYRLDGDSQSADSLTRVIKRKSLENRSKDDENVLKVHEVMSSRHLMVAEAVSSVKFISPGVKNEDILATNISGMKNGVFASLGAQYQTFGLYQDVLDVFDKDYISPVNKAAIHQYDYYIEDTTFYQQDTVFVISFAPQKNREFEALEGLMWIHADDFAITNVIANSANSESNIDIRIQQQYDRIMGRWFPIQLDTEIKFSELDFYGRNLILENKRYISDVNFDTDFSNEDFSDVSINIGEVEEEVQQNLFEQHRVDSLSQLELNTYLALDTMAHLKVVEGVAEVMFTQRLELGVFDLKLDDILGFNDYEQTRIGAGLVTNDRISKVVKVGGNLGYGLDDKTWKHGAHLKININRRADAYLIANYRNDLREVGSQVFFEGKAKGAGDFVRSWQGDRYDRQRLFNLNLNTRIVPFVYAQLGVSSSEEYATYPYQFSNSKDILINAHQINEVSLALRYVRNEQYMDLYGKKFLFDMDFPVINVRYAQGNTALGGDYNYQRFDGTVEYKKKYRLGYSKVMLKGGYITGNLPFGRLITGWGNSSSLFSANDYFQTMALYEFLSDQAVAILFSHNFGNVLISRKMIKPEFVVYHNAGVGQLSNETRHQGVDFLTMEKGYFESGLGLRNLIRLNYLNVGYMGFGVEAYYRHGSYSFPDHKDNIAFKINMNFSF